MNVRSALMVIVLIVAMLGGMAWASSSFRPFDRSRSHRTASSVNSEDDRIRDQIAHYREWKLVNPTPQRMEPLSAAACARVLGRNEGSPHLHKFISVYVNSIGADAMLTMKVPVFPEGSIIVKEKLPDATSKEPELLTVMRKREKGYNPASGDWEYLTLDGNATNITERGKIETCNACHTAHQRTDYITRTYLPSTVLEGLK